MTSERHGRRRKKKKKKKKTILYRPEIYRLAGFNQQGDAYRYVKSNAEETAVDHTNG